MQYLRSNLLLLCLLYFLALHAREDDNDDKKRGNFALPGSQQPSTFFTFGQNILEKDLLMALNYLEYRKIDGAYICTEFPYALYGIRNDLSILVACPFVISFDGSCRKVGIGDIYGQLEYAYYQKDLGTSQIQTTLVGGMSLPTGSGRAAVPTILEPGATGILSLTSPVAARIPAGLGAVGFFLGTTAAFYSQCTYVFACLGGGLPTSHHGTRFGKQLLYQVGIGNNLTYRPNEMIFSCLVELFGNYMTRNRICGIMDPNSGGNLFHVAPSLFLSTQHFIIEMGVAFPVAQHFFGTQSKEKFTFAVQMAWTF